MASLQTEKDKRSTCLVVRPKNYVHVGLLLLRSKVSGSRRERRCVSVYSMRVAAFVIERERERERQRERDRQRERETERERQRERDRERETERERGGRREGERERGWGGEEGGRAKNQKKVSILAQNECLARAEKISP